MKKNEILVFFIALFFSASCSYLSTGFNNVGSLIWLSATPIFLYSFFNNYKRTASLSYTSYLLGSLSYFEYFSTIPDIMITIMLKSFLYTCIILLCKYIFSTNKKWYILFFPASIFACTEFIFSLISDHGTFGSLAYSQIDNLPLIQIVSITGLYGVTFLIYLFSFSLAKSIYIFIINGFKKSLISFLPTFIIFLSVFIFGFWRINSLKDNKSENLKVGLASIDSLFALSFIPNEKTATEIIQKYLALIPALKNEGARIIVFPEKILTLTNKYESTIARLTAEAAKKYEVLIIIGVRRMNIENKNYNSAWIFSKEGVLTTTYNKNYLLPGFEINTKNGLPELTPGKSFIGFKYDQNKFGIAICKDMDFQTTALAISEQKASIVFVPALDFVTDAWLHGKMAIFRGIEGGFSVVRAPAQGILMVSDETGKILSKVTTSETKITYAIVAVPFGKGYTFFSKYQHLFLYIFGVNSFLMVLLSIPIRKPKTAKV